MAISMLSEGSKAHFQNDLNNIFNMIFGLANSQNPRIVYDVMTAISLLCIEFSVNFSFSYF